MLRNGGLALALAAMMVTAALAQPAPSSNYTSFEATSAKPVQIGYYAEAHKDCTPAPLPTIRVIEAPKSGTLTVRVGELKTNQVAGCPGLKTPARVVFYQARGGALGLLADSFLHFPSPPELSASRDQYSRPRSVNG